LGLSNRVVRRRRVAVSSAGSGLAAPAEPGIEEIVSHDFNIYVSAFSVLAR
jgi:hypothetical protein